MKRRYLFGNAWIPAILFFSAATAAAATTGNNDGEATNAATRQHGSSSPRVLTINAAGAERIVVVTQPPGGDAPDSPRSAAKPATEKKDDSNDFSLAVMKDRLERTWRKHLVHFERFSLWKIVVLFTGIALTFFIAKIARWWVEEYLRRFTQKTRSEIDELTCAALGRPIGLLIVSAGLFLSAFPLVSTMPEPVFIVFENLCAAMAAGAVAWALYRLVKVINHVLTTMAERTDNNIDDLIVAIVRKSLKVTVVVVSILFIGQNILGLKITTLLAGAGVVGLALAFAAQDTIANFFGSIMIILDRPFVVNERVEIDGVEGIVESMGFRSTKIRRLDGHLVSIPNKNVAAVAIRNVTKRPFIKETFNFTLVYDTPPEKVERAVEILHEAYDDQPCMDMDNRPPHIVFNSFNDWALNIKVIIWHHPGDFFVFERWNHERNLEILRRFNAEGIKFAFPSNTTYLAQDDKRKLNVDVGTGRDGTGSE